MRGNSVFRRRRMSAKGHLLNFSKLRFLCRKRIHNRRPSRIDPFEDEHSIFDSAIHEKPLRHIWFVRVQINELPCSQNRCSKQNGEFSFFSHFKSMSFRAARIVAANRMANFLSSVISTAYTSLCISPPGMPRPFASSCYGR